RVAQEVLGAHPVVGADVGLGRPVQVVQGGAALLVGADWASQRLFGADKLPVGALTGMFGGCYLLWLLFKERKAGRV
ncbi:iron chelate uptake ABC transporter family permease subunit, partial [Streptomyces klenkii]|uniref:iron chelate uptake ABC transporter family permease subunit n=1 Tax=Streptomyces klenkii TaxID=1420899 RepID=UPI0033B71281